jgi:hypothetical protein
MTFWQAYQNLLADAVIAVVLVAVAECAWRRICR